MAAKQRFIPSDAATTYRQVQDEAFAFYSLTARSFGVASRLASQAAQRWERSQPRSDPTVEEG